MSYNEIVHEVAQITEHPDDAETVFVDVCSIYASAIMTEPVARKLLWSYLQCELSSQYHPSAKRDVIAKAVDRLLTIPRHYRNKRIKGGA